jgi:hypothetical protein
MVRMMGRLLCAIVAHPFFVPFSAISAPNGLITTDSERAQEDEKRSEEHEGHGGMHGGGDEDDDARDAREDDSTDAGQRGEIRVQRLRHSLLAHSQCRQR